VFNDVIIRFFALTLGENADEPKVPSCTLILVLVSMLPLHLFWHPKLMVNATDYH
jgi:hypothetical protein